MAPMPPACALHYTPSSVYVRIPICHVAAIYKTHTSYYYAIQYKLISKFNRSNLSDGLVYRIDFLEQTDFALCVALGAPRAL